jgi:hypothetical protein
MESKATEIESNDSSYNKSGLLPKGIIRYFRPKAPHKLTKKKVYEVINLKGKSICLEKS